MFIMVVYSIIMVVYFVWPQATVPRRKHAKTVQPAKNDQQDQSVPSMGLGFGLATHSRKKPICYENEKDE